MNEEPIDVLMAWARERNWNRSELARRLGESPQTIYNWTRRGLPADKYASVAKSFGRSVSELLGDVPDRADRPVVEDAGMGVDAVTVHRSGSPVVDPAAGSGEFARHATEAVAGLAPSGDVATQAHELSLAPGEMWLPRHDGVYPRMGRGGMDDGQEVVTLVRVSIEGFKRQLGAARVTSLNALRLVTAFGDSMRPTFDDGDMLVIDTGVQAVGQDGVYLLRGPDDILVKRVQRKSDGAWLLISSNKEYETERIEPDRRDEFAVLGRVVFAWRGEVV